jgi:hypothetical protein
MKKRCAIPGCTDPCRAGDPMCRWHWKMVPQELKRAVWGTQRAMQLSEHVGAGGVRASVDTRLSVAAEFHRALRDAVIDVCRQLGLKP